MFSQVITVIEAVLKLIHEAEEKLGPGKGEAKRAFVLDRAARELGALAPAGPVQGCTPATIASYVGALIDHTVGLLNCLGVFPKSAPAPATSSPAASSEPPPPPPTT